MKTKALDKVLKNHLPHCKMHEFSLQKDRHCSCGVEKAREENERKDEIIKQAEVVIKGWRSQYGYFEAMSLLASLLERYEY